MEPRAPIELSKEVNAEFKQRGGSCVLASYAVAASYFTQLPIGVFFAGYCEHFGLAVGREGECEELLYARHFDAEWRARNVRGYELVLALHNRSPVACFCAARAVMRGTFFMHSDTRHLEKALRKRCAFLNVTYEPDSAGNEYHSITAFSDGKYVFARDTNRKNCFLLAGKGLREIGTLRDSVLYERTEKKKKKK